jgi:uncharacterized protein YjbI with pentapeptide repeats
LNLSYIYLSGVIASNSHFENCQLKKSNFQGSFMDKSRFIGCSLEESTFSGIHSIHNSSDWSKLFILIGASLKQSSFSNDNALSGINFINTDLFNSQLNISDPHNKNITLTNTRLPDGSFSNIDSKGLIKDGGAEEQVIISFFFLFYPIKLTFLFLV